MKPSLLRWVLFAIWTIAATVDVEGAYDIEGTAVDSTTSKPLSGVRVAATWERHRGVFGGGTHHSCAKVSTAITGTDGRFSLPGPDIIENNPLGMSVAFNAHLAGWEAQKRKDKVLLMQPVSVDRNDRIRSFLDLTRFSTYCNAEHSTPGIKEFGASVAAEAQSIALTPWERTIAKVLALRARDPLDWIANYPAEEKLIFDYVRSGDDDPDGRDPRDRTRLMRAADAGDLEGVRREIVRGAKPNRVSKDGTALKLAVSRYGTAKVDKRTDVDRRWQVVMALLEAPGIDPDRVQSGHPTLLATSVRDPELVEALLKAGADPNLVSGRQSPLQAVVMRRIQTLDQYAADADRAMRLVVRHPRTDLNAPGGAERTALTDAVTFHHEFVVRELLEAGADPNVTSPRVGPLIMIAVESAMRAPNEPRRNVLRLLAEHPAIRMDDVRLAHQIAAQAGRDDLVAILTPRLDRPQ